MSAQLSALTLVISAPDGSHQVLAGSDERAYRKAFGSFVDAWGEDSVWYDNDAKQLGSDGGVTLSRWRARVLGTRADLALLVLVDGQVVGLYMVDDADMAERAAAALEGESVRFELVPVSPLPPADPEIDSLPLTKSVRTRAGGSRPAAPRPMLSETFCGRCEDHPLHVEPLFDARTGDGARVCIACGKLDAWREAAGRGNAAS